jgi:hypothetical protein
MMEVIFNQESLIATYYPEKKRILFKFTGYNKMETMIEMYKKIHDYMKSHETVSFLNDLREMKGTFTNLTDWLFSNMRNTLDLGLKCIAIVTSDDVFTEFAAEDFSKRVQILELKIFKDMGEAEEWVATIEKKHL